MNIIRSLSDWPAQARCGAFAIGVFDGVHLGHQAVISEVVKRAGESASAVITFEPHPMAVLGKEPPPFLTSFEQKCDLFSAHGVQTVLALEFTPEFAALSPEQFCEMLSVRLSPQWVVVGRRFRFGAEGRGDLSTLIEAGKKFGFSALGMPDVSVGGIMASSTAIRCSVQKGRLADAAKLLGRHYAVRGPVARGFGRGRSLGFPTANVCVPEGQLLPPEGVYAARTRLNDANYAAVVNLGRRPTFGSGEPTLEAFIIGFEGDLYGKTLDVEFVEHLRPEIRFDTPDDLRTQVGSDARQAMEMLEGVSKR